MTKRLEHPADFTRYKRQFDFIDDFYGYDDGVTWTKIDGDAGASVAIDADGVGGRMLLTTGATDNNECYLHTTNELFDIQADNPIRIGALVQYAESNTDDANVLFGLMNAAAANHILDDGGGPAADYSGAVIYKVDGETVWRCESSVSTTQTSSTSKTTAGGSAFQLLEIQILPVSSTKCEVTFWVDGIQLEDTNRLAGERLIMHNLTYTSITEMNLIIGVKAGSASSEVLTVDMAGWGCLR